MRPPRRVAATAATALLMGALAGCADDGPTVLVVGAEPTVASTGEVAAVQAIDNTFQDDRLVVPAGTQVRWTNEGENDHDVVAVGGSDFGVTEEQFTPGQEYAHVFTAPGEYPYYCSLHGTPTAGMTGVIVVEG